MHASSLNQLPTLMFSTISNACSHSSTIDQTIEINMVIEFTQDFDLLLYSFYPRYCGLIGHVWFPPISVYAARPSWHHTQTRMSRGQWEGGTQGSTFTWTPWRPWQQLEKRKRRSRRRREAKETQNRYKKKRANDEWVKWMWWVNPSEAESVDTIATE